MKNVLYLSLLQLFTACGADFQTERVSVEGSDSIETHSNTGDFSEGVRDDFEYCLRDSLNPDTTSYDKFTRIESIRC